MYMSKANLHMAVSSCRAPLNLTPWVCIACVLCVCCVYGVFVLCAVCVCVDLRSSFTLTYPYPTAGCPVWSFRLLSRSRSAFSLILFICSRERILILPQGVRARASGSSPDRAPLCLLSYLTVHVKRILILPQGVRAGASGSSPDRAPLCLLSYLTVHVNVSLSYRRVSGLELQAPLPIALRFLSYLI